MAVKPAISEVISNSPLALLERHAGVCVDCVERLPLYFEEAQARRERTSAAWKVWRMN